MELLSITVRTLVMYAVILISMRIMGKREIGKLSVFDLVISILIAELAVIIIDDPERPYIEGMLPIIIVVTIQFTLSWVMLKNQTIRYLLDGKPSYLINQGQLDRKEMKKQRYNLDDLMMQLRDRNIRNVADVEFAILEPSGKLSVVPKKDYKKDGQEKKSKSGIPGIRFEGLPVALIMDGKVQDRNLEKIGKTRFWLKNELQQKGVNDFKEVFLCTIDHKGQIFVSNKDDSSRF
ncbi:DUF421 domain-containing protein [Paenibacillus turpanensis]|uniref:DUF421 domain-containing protein n=1 Tax=Paenibacillus turpanensis TaxID=2689078 RepID=UPI00140E3232|nr:DUF421 domain-containing protein [Paenibacillus turpanensis]